MLHSGDAEVDRSLAAGLVEGHSAAEVGAQQGLLSLDVALFTLDEVSDAFDDVLEWYLLARVLGSAVLGQAVGVHLARSSTPGHAPSPCRPHPRSP
jgi:hypothetical protein